MLLFALQNFLELEFLLLSEIPHLNHAAVVFQSSFQAHYVSLKVMHDFFLWHISHEAANHLSIAYTLLHIISSSNVSFAWLAQRLVS